MRRAIVIAAIVLAGLGAVVIRVDLAGNAAVRDGDDWRLRGKPAAAIRSYEAAARWYLPFASHVDKAYARLRELTMRPAVGPADPELELAAWRAIHAAATATRGLWQPHAADLADADAAIARLSARATGAGEGAGTTTGAREAWYVTHLEDARPPIAALAFAGLGVLLWLGGAIALARRGIDAAGTLVRRPAAAAGTVIVLGLVTWIVGLYNA